jgi:hypothetical protein
MTENKDLVLFLRDIKMYPNLKDSYDDLQYLKLYQSTLIIIHIKV